MVGAIVMGPFTEMGRLGEGWEAGVEEGWNGVVEPEASFWTYIFSTYWKSRA